MADMDRWKTVESAMLYLVHLVCMKRLSARRDFSGVHSWQNGTKCRDGVKVLWCHSYLVWLVFIGFDLYMHLHYFIQETFL